LTFFWFFNYKICFHIRLQKCIQQPESNRGTLKLKTNYIVPVVVDSAGVAGAIGISAAGAVGISGAAGIAGAIGSGCPIGATGAIGSAGAIGAIGSGIAGATGSG
jgi:hypothetical protein